MNPWRKGEEGKKGDGEGGKKERKEGREEERKKQEEGKRRERKEKEAEKEGGREELFSVSLLIHPPIPFSKSTPCQGMNMFFTFSFFSFHWWEDT